MADYTPRIGDLVFIKGNWITSKLIRWYTCSEFSHVAVYFGRGLILEADWAGVMLSPLKKYGAVEHEIVPLPKGIDRVKFVRALFREIGDGYDYLLFLGGFLAKTFPFLKPLIGYWDSKHRWLCIEYVVEALESVGETFPQFESTNLMLPDDLYNIYHRE